MNLDDWKQQTPEQYFGGKQPDDVSVKLTFIPLNGDVQILRRLFSNVEYEEIDGNGVAWFMVESEEGDKQLSYLNTMGALEGTDLHHRVLDFELA